jgi:hypothetical protein
MPRHVMQASQVRAHYKDLIVCGNPVIMDRAMSMPRPFWDWLNSNYMAGSHSSAAGGQTLLAAELRGGSRIYLTERHLSAWIR